ncbi:MAG: adenylate/guanylate cyclase domain-containing protein, partial [Acidimicrobiia bacterium]
DPRSTMVAGSNAVALPANLRQTSIELVADAVTEAQVDLSRSADQGTISIVFSDIESSTQRAEALGDERWFELLSIHNEIVRREVAAHHGTEIKAQGDGFMLTFPSARGAVRCMANIQRLLADHSESDPANAVRVRVGIHTGEAIADEDGDLFGRHVNRAARIANEADGGEILVSALVREIIEPRGDVEFGDARVAQLKGLTGPQTMYPIVWGAGDVPS